jgi:hypothetical protein
VSLEGLLVAGRKLCPESLTKSTRGARLDISGVRISCSSADRCRMTDPTDPRLRSRQAMASWASGQAMKKYIRLVGTRE